MQRSEIIREVKEVRRSNWEIIKRRGCEDEEGDDEDRIDEISHNEKDSLTFEYWKERWEKEQCNITAYIDV